MRLESKMPKFKHDCGGCKFLGTTNIKYRGDREHDIYICGNEEQTHDVRDIVLRYGNEDHEYTSYGIFEGTVLSWTDRIILMNGFELTKTEEQRLLKVLCSEYQNKLTQKDYRNFLIDFDGPGNVFYHPGKI